MALIWSGCQPGETEPPWQEAFGYSDRDLHSVRLGEFGFPFVQVGIHGDTLWLPFDTGNMVGLSVKTETFRELDLPCSDRWNSYDSGGEPISSSCVAEGVPASVFGADRDSVRIYELTGHDVPGLVGPNEVPGSRYTLDYDRGLIAVGEGAGPSSVPGFASIPVVRSPRHPRLVLVRGSLAGREVLLEIDTGKSRTTVDRELVRELGAEKTDRGVLLGEIRLGPRVFRPGPARVVQTSGISQGLPMPISLGMGSDILSEFVFTVDYETGLLWVEAP